MWQKWLKRSCLGLIAFQAVALHGAGVVGAGMLDGLYVKAGLGLTWANQAKADCAASDKITTISATGIKVKRSSPWIFAIGYNWNERWRTEIACNISPRINYRLKNNVEDESKGRLQSMSTMVNVFHDFQKLGTVIPYMGAGVGVASNKIKSSKWPSVNEGASSTKSVVWNVALGVREEISKSFWVDAAWRYTDLGKFRTNGQFSDGTNGASTTFKRLQAQEIVVTFSYYL